MTKPFWQQAIKIICLILGVLPLTACPKRVRISDRVVIQNSTMIGGAEASTIDTDDYKKLDKGIKLNHGDVIYLRNWSPGTQEPQKWRSNRTSPASNSYRIPLRRVSDHQRLYPYEREILATILTVNRTNEFNETSPAAVKLRGRLVEFLKKNEVVLWNALVSNLKLKRVKNSGQAEGNLVLTIYMPGFLASLPNCTNAADDDCVNLRSLFHPHPDKESETPEVELMGLDKLYSSPWDAITNNETFTRNEDFYGSGIGNIPFAIFNFVIVERNGIDINHPQWPENRWTLLDWEESNICRDVDTSLKPRIEKIYLGKTAESFTIARPDTKKLATYYVSLERPDGTIAREVVRRADAKGNHKAINVDDLSRLFVEDITGIQWGLPLSQQTKKKKRPLLLNQNNCQLP